MFFKNSNLIVRLSLTFILLGGMLGALQIKSVLAAETNSNNKILIDYQSKDGFSFQADIVPVFVQVSTGSGSRFTCALTADGKVKCWGKNDVGQLGNGSTTQSAAPVDVLTAPGGVPLTGVTSIVTGANHACALLASGS